MKTTHTLPNREPDLYLVREPGLTSPYFVPTQEDAVILAKRNGTNQICPAWRDYEGEFVVGLITDQFYTL
jgi:hypothetical protein